MAIFDEFIAKTAVYVAEMRAEGRLVRELSLTPCAADLSAQLRIKIGPGSSPGIVLKSDTFLELGSPAAGSCAFALYSDHASLIEDGRISLIGPDVPEAAADTLSFGQVIMAAGETLTDADYHHLIQSQYIGDRIEGYMVKSTPGLLWTRVSKQVAEKGFSFQFLGLALMKLVKAQLPKVTAAEVIFVTSGKSDVQRLGEIGALVSAVSRDIKAGLWKDRGINIAECAFAGHCGSCEDKTACDEIKNILSSRKKISAASSGESCNAKRLPAIS